MHRIITDKKEGLTTPARMQDRVQNNFILPDRLQPIAIPPTTPRRYLSFYQALNLRFLTEVTGDWHFMMVFYSPAGSPQVEIPLAGVGMPVDTTPVLGELGVRDMADVLVRQGILANNSHPVWAANHARAIADLAMEVIPAPYQPYTLTVNEVNQWLDTREQVDDLVQNYLIPLRQLKEGVDLAPYDDWLQTIHYQ